MMQELFSGSNVGIIGGADRSKLSNANCAGIFDNGGGHSPSPSSSAATAAAAAPESLRCPRCDSPNTKFCYYNNYNLTQPRHFCKTCRRYWTKGGALRNVPIGGGCRKNKSTTITSAVGKSGSAAAKLKTTLSSEMVKTGLFSGGFEHEPLPSNPILWGPSQNSHILSLLRSNNQNHHYNNSPGHGLGIGSSMINARVMGLDPLDPTHLPSSFRNQATDQPSPGFGQLGLADQTNNGFQLQELYQRFRSTTSYNYPDQNGPVILGHVASANTSMNSSAILESAPVAAAGELGFWNNNNNPTLSWPIDLPTTSTTNGGYP